MSNIDSFETTFELTFEVEGNKKKPLPCAHIAAYYHWLETHSQQMTPLYSMRAAMLDGAAH